MIKLLLNTMKAGDWSKALDFLSPTFFDVVPTLGMARVMGSLSSNYVNRTLIDQTKHLWTARLTGLDEQLRWGDGEPGAPLSSQKDRQREGQIALKLYFAGLLFPQHFFLDLRSNSFEARDRAWLWLPKPWIYCWSEDFRTALLDVYAGFYEDQEEMFHRGLKALNLEHAADLFLSIFGPARDQPILFSLDQFRASFHQIFLACSKSKSQLHPDFLALGILLFALYEHAEQLAVPLSPHEAWHELIVWKKSLNHKEGEKA